MSLKQTQKWIEDVSEQIYTTEELKKLTMLDLSWNEINKIPLHIFDKLTNIQELDLSVNNINIISSQIFIKLNNLTKLDLSNNEITCFDNDIFKGLENLKNINFNNNPIDFVGENVLLPLQNIKNINGKNLCVFLQENIHNEVWKDAIINSGLIEKCNIIFEISKEEIIEEEVYKRQYNDNDETLWNSEKYCSFIDNEKTLALQPSTCYSYWFQYLPLEFNNAQAKSLASMLDPTITLSSTEQEICDIISRFEPDDIWFIEQEKYLNNLSVEYRQLFNMYSYLGDYNLNKFLRKNFNDISEVFSGIITTSILVSKIFENYRKKENLSEFGKKQLQNIDINNLSIHAAYWKPQIFYDILSKITNDINQLIISAPRSEKDIFVFRGLKNINDINKEIIISKGYLSTSLNLTTALKFTKNTNFEQPVLLRIFVPKNTPLLFISSLSGFKDEIEILFPHNIEIIMEECIENTPIYYIDQEFNQCKRKIITLCNARLNYIES